MYCIKLHVRRNLICNQHAFRTLEIPEIELWTTSAKFSRYLRMARTALHTGVRSDRETEQWDVNERLH